MTRRTAAFVAWGLAAAVVVVSVLVVIENVRRGDFEGASDGFVESLVQGLIEAFIAPFFALLAALIISNQPRNIIGWLLMIPALGAAIIDPISLWVATIETPPETLNPVLFLALWVENWSWLLFLFPIFHLLQVFPTGRVLTPRWRWLAFLEVAMFVVFVGMVTFSDVLGPSTDEVEASWVVTNPIGFIPLSIWEGGFMSVWTFGLLILVIGGGASTVVRFRRAQAAEKQQLKWLLGALVLFASVYAATAVAVETFDTNIVLDVLFLLSIAVIPLAMTMAVLRYRLFDIDVIIRKTLVYGLLTGLLTATYFGSVVVLQSVFRGEGTNSVTVAASTLLITASFSPLRRRIQSLIDRRLFRSKYNAQVVIERFGGAAQNQANLERLSADLMAVVEETIQPRSGVLWIREPAQTTAKAR